MVVCFFPKKNLNIDSIAYRKGIVEFECGVCPECLRKRASVWALRAVHEARDHAFNAMVCLTYDQYVHDSKSGRVVGERVSDLSVCKRDVQLFIKRLRKWCDSVGQKNIKYIATAEYGKRTHRAHYHVLLFGVRFFDCVPYKKSKRGNLIYRSATLERLWKNGICTVDSQNVSASAARYCTKYCTKDTRSEDTFSLFSHGIGLSSLITDFNGKSYIVEGREYPIPRAVWNFIITNRYRDSKHGAFTCKYLNTPFRLLGKKTCNESGDRVVRKTCVACMQNDYQRSRFRELRDHDPLYRSYLKYWRNKAVLFKLSEKPVLTRILELPDEKYALYKASALECLAKREFCDYYPAPRSSLLVYENYKLRREVEYRRSFIKLFGHLPCVSRLYTANDTIHFVEKLFGRGKLDFGLNPFDFPRKFQKFSQISFDNLLTS